MASVYSMQCSSSAVCILFVLLIPCVCCQYSTVIEVTGGKSVVGCNTTTDSMLCSSLDELAKVSSAISDSTQVILVGSIFNLSTSLNIEHVSDFEFISSPNLTALIRCIGTGSSLLFRVVNGLRIARVSFLNCGAQYDSTSFKNATNLYLWSAIYIQNCTDVTIDKVAVNQSHSFGVVIYDTNGTVAVTNSVFDSNGANSSEDGGGGMYIELTSCPPGSPFYSEHEPLRRRQCVCEYNQKSVYTIKNCIFKGNIANTSQTYIKRGGFRTFGQGGGLLIAVNGNATGNSFLLSGCVFEQNRAVWGGGFHCYLTGKVHSNNVSVEDCQFENNSVVKGGGGFIIYTHASTIKDTMQTKVNSIYVARSDFSGNKATDSAGGMLVLITVEHFTDVIPNHIFHFKDCVWHGNSAWFSAAVDIISHHSSDVVTGTFPKFTNCSFFSNYVRDHETVIANNIATQSVWGRGTFMVIYARVVFETKVIFENNKGSALYVGSGLVEFVQDTNAEFINNSGIYGGAVALQSSSFMKMGGNNKLEFINNSALASGGAIYSYSMSQHELHHHTSSLGCFLHAKRNSNITFVFNGNRVTSRTFNRGHSVYATSLLACSSQCSDEDTPLNASSIFSCVSNFEFQDLSPKEQISGPGWNFILPHKQNFSVIPGKEFDLLFDTIDGLNNSVPSTMKAFVDEKFGVVVDPAYAFHSGGKMKVHGRPGVNFELELERSGFRKLFLYLNITLLECPPGYIYSTQQGNTSLIDKAGTCRCSWTGNYEGILRCSSSQFRAYIIRGFWAGYWDNISKESNFRSANCPLNYCVYNASSLEIAYLLPERADAIQLDDFICDQTRTGVLCGSCIKNHSVYFHSPKYKCGPDEDCKYGMLLYIFSELLPLTVIFIAVMVFNVSFTSGTLNGFILFAQVIDTFSLDTYSLRDARQANSIPAFMFIYGFFNLHFFHLDQLSFCLWKGAETLDVIAFKYVSILYAFCLVLFAVVVMRFCNVARLCKVFKKRSYHSSIVHGLSTFLVMCSVQCVRVSFAILTPRVINGLNLNNRVFRVLISGDVEYFDRNHFLYAVPALICLAVVVAIPLILLLWFPAGQKLLSFCGFGETRLPRIINKALCVYRLNPLLDSFQSCFKDKYRFFAGLYFLYRYLSQVAFSFTTGITQFYLIIELLLIGMLLVHAIAQPYISRRYNIIDTLLFINLAVINALSMFLHAKATSQYYKNTVAIVTVAQEILIILPLLCCLAVILFKIGLLLKPYVTKRSRGSSVLHLEDSLPARLVYDDLDRSGSESEKSVSPSKLSSANYRSLGDSELKRY